MDMFGDSIDLAIGGLWMASPFMTGFVLELYIIILYPSYQSLPATITETSSL